MKRLLLAVALLTLGFGSVALADGLPGPKPPIPGVMDGLPGPIIPG
jgi:hypothetical protein